MSSSTRKGIYSRSRRSEFGNVFFTLFGAVAVVGVLGAGIMATMRGPLSTMVEVNRREQAKAELRVAASLVLVSADDAYVEVTCEGGAIDGYTEGPAPGANITGNIYALPAVGAAMNDPWGNAYGYCAWDHGPLAADYDGACAGYLAGNVSTNNVAIAVMSAGPDGTFQTTCVADNAGTPPEYVEPDNGGGDDVVVTMTYDQAISGSGGLWNLNAVDPNIAEIAKDLDVTGDVSITGGGAFTDVLDMTGANAQLQLGQASMTLPNQATLSACTAAENGLIRINTTAGYRVEVCQNGTGWVPAGSSWDTVAGGVNYSGGNVGIGVALPNDALDVAGTAQITGAVDLDNNLDVAGTSTLGGALTVNATAALNGDVVITGDATGGGTDALTVRDSSNSVIFTVQNDSMVGINNASPNDQLDVNGAIDTTDFFKIDNAIFLNGDSTIPGTILLGESAGANVTGDNNIIVGGQSANTLTSGTGNIIIGSGLDVPTATGATTADYLNIGDLVVGDIANSRVGIGFATDTDVSTFNDTLEVNGSMDVTGTGVFGDNVQIYGDTNDGTTDPLTLFDSDSTEVFAVNSDGYVDADSGADFNGTVEANDYTYNGNDFTPGSCAAGSFNRWTGTAWVCEVDGAGAGGGTQDLDSVLTNGNDAGGSDIVNLADPTNAQDAATKAYVDSQVGGLSQDRIEDTGDQNTYIDVDTANDDSLNTISMATAGTERMLISSTGNFTLTGATSSLDINLANADPVLTSSSNELRIDDNLEIRSGNSLNLYNAANGSAGSLTFNTSDLVLSTLTGDIALMPNASVGIGTAAPDTSSALDITSTTQGMLAPRMTIAQRDAIGTPATGLLVFATDAGTNGIFQFYDGSAWVDVGAGGASGAGIWQEDGTNDYIEYDDTLGGVRIGRVTGQPAPEIDWNLDVTNSWVYRTGDVALGSSTVSGALVLDVTGNVGATQYCDADGNNCFTAATVAGGGGSTELSNITAATANNTINNAAWNQVWNWQLTGAEAGLTFGESAASTGGSSDQYVVVMETLAGSTAIPLTVSNVGNAHSFVVNDASADTTPFIIDNAGNVGIGTATPSSVLHTQNGDITIGDTADLARKLFLQRNGAMVGKVSTDNGDMSIEAMNGNNIRIVPDGGITDGGMTILDNGNVGIGTLSANEILTVSSANSDVDVISFANQSDIQLKMANGSEGSEAIVADTEVVGSIRYGGYDSAKYIHTIQMYGVVNGTPGVDDIPLDLVIGMDPAGTPWDAADEMFRISSGGDITMSGTGALQFHSGTDAQRPTGADGMIRFNTDNDAYEVYSTTAGAWIEIVSAGAVAGGVAGNDTEVQFNDGGSPGADAGLTFNQTTDTLTVGTAINVGETITITGQAGNAPTFAALNDLSDTSVAGAADGDLLYYNNTSGNWETIAQSAIAGSAPDRIEDTGDQNTYIDVDTDDADGNNTIEFHTAGSERMRIANDGTITVGDSTTLPTLSGNQSYQFYTDASVTNSGDLALGSTANTPNRRPDLEFFRARGTPGTETVVQDGDAIGGIRFTGYDGDSWENRARITGLVNGTVADGDVPMDIVFDTGDTATAEAMRITSAGRVGIGAATPYLDLDVAGAVKIADTVEACDVNREGGIRYVAGSNTFFFCADTANGWEAISLGSGVTEITDLTDAYTDYTTEDNLIMGRAGAAALAAGAQFNVFIGENAGATTANSTATTDKNTAVGYFALNGLTTGSDNTAFGNDALASTTTGIANTAIGSAALGANTIGTTNLAIGRQALQSNVGRGNNLAIGYQAMRFSNDTATAADGNNIAIGNFALMSTGTASSNTGNRNLAIGVRSMQNTTSGSDNIAIGYQAGDLNTTGNNNILIGNDTDAPTATTNDHLNIGNLIYGDIANKRVAIGTTDPSTPDSNTFPALKIVGESASSTAADLLLMQFNNAPTSKPDVAMYRARGTAESGALKVEDDDVVGNLRFRAHDGVDWNDAGGIQVEVDGATASNDVPTRMVFGTSGGASSLERMRIDSSGGVGINTGAANDASAIFQADSTTRGLLFPRMNTTQRDNISVPATGLQVYNTSTNTVDYYNGSAWVSFAASGGSVSELDDLTDAATTAGDFNIFIGHTGGSYGANDQYNLGLGYGALDGLINSAAAFTGDYNTAIGHDAMTANTTGDQNVAVGTGALSSNVAGRRNTAIGRLALQDSIGSDNAALGRSTLAQVTGDQNTGLGTYAGRGLPASSDIDNNVFIGYNAANGVLTGADNNTIIGHNAASTLTTGANNIIIGKDADVTGAAASNELNIGDTIFGDLTNNYVGIGTAAPESTLNLSDAAAMAPEIRFTDTDVTQPDYQFSSSMDPFSNTNTFGTIRQRGNAGNGLEIIGMTGSGIDNERPLTLVGTHGGSTPTEAAVEIAGQKKQSGVNNRTALTGSEPVLDVRAAAYSAVAPLMRVQADGFIGFGTATPAQPLDIENIDPDIILTDTDDAGTSEFLFSDSTNSRARMYYDHTNNYMGIDTDRDGDASGELRFYKGATEQMRITSGGNVGIGDWASDTIESALHIQTGDIRIDGGAANEAGCIRFDDTTDKIQFSHDCTTFSDMGGAAGAIAINDLTDGTTTYGSSDNIFMGNNIGGAHGATDIRNVSLGLNNFTALNNLGATNNSAFGFDSLESITDGDENTAYGYASLNALSSGSNNAALGASAAYQTTTGNENTALGFDTLSNNTIGDNNVAIGSSALGNPAAANGDMDDNVAVGRRAGFSVAGGAAGLGGNQNVLLGSLAGSNITTGDGNIVIGYDSGSSTISTGSNNILIGYDVEATAAPASNELNIGNTIYGDLSTKEIYVGDMATSPIAGMTTGIEIIGDGSDRDLAIHSYGAGSTPDIEFIHAEGPNYAGIAVNDSGDDLGRIRVSSYDGTKTIRGLSDISFEVSGTPAVDDIPVDIVFNTGDGSGGNFTPTERMRITSGGNVGIGETAPLANLHVQNAEQSITTSHFAGSSNFVLEDTDAVISLVSSETGADGSMIEFNEVATGALIDKWSLVRNTTNGTGDGRLVFRYGTDNNGWTHPEILHLATNGRIGIGNFASDTVESNLHIQEGDIRLDGGAANEAGCFRFDDTANEMQYSDDCTTFTSFSNITGSPGGADTHVQYNNAGAFSGEAAFTYDDSNDTLTVATLSATDRISLAPKTAIGTPNGLSIDDLSDVDVAGVTDTQILQYNSATGNWEASNAGGSSQIFEVTGAAGSEVISTVDANAPYLTSDFVVGSAALDDNTGSADDDHRMFFDKSKAAFRVGDSANGTGWDDANIGSNSFATGFGSQATGNVAVAMGNIAIAGSNGVALGSQVDATGSFSTALGRDADATGTDSFAIGLGASATDPQVSGTSSMGIFMGDNNAYNLTANNRLALVGGDFMIDDAGATGSQGCFRYDGTNSKLQYSHDCSSFTDLDVSGATTGGADTQVLFNNAGAEDGDAGLTYSATSDTLNINSTVNVGDLINIGATTGAAAPTGATNVATLNLNDLGDVDTTGFADGEVLTYNGTSGNWESAASAGGGALNDLSDVTTNYTDNNMFLGQNIASGILAGAIDNTFLGEDSGRDLTSGFDNTLMGFESGAGIMTGSDNAGFGHSALERMDSGSSNTGIGKQAMNYLTSGSFNTAIGRHAGNLNDIGNNNVAVGYNAGGTAFPTAGTISDSVFVGYSAGSGMASGAANNIFIGYQAGDLTTTGTDNIIIGYDVDPSAATASNELNIGGTIFGDLTNDLVGIGQVPASGVELDVLGDIEYTGTITDVSDRRLKDNIKPLNKHGTLIDKLQKIDTYSFTMKDDDEGKTEFGVMAQELEEIFPELVRTADDEMGTKSVNYVGLIAPMIEATKELKAENETLRAELAEMNAEKAEIHAAVSDLSKQVELLNKVAGNNVNKASTEHWLYMLLGLFAGLSIVLVFTRRKTN